VGYVNFLVWEVGAAETMVNRNSHTKKSTL